MTEGQRLALRQLQAVAAADPEALEIVAVREPEDDFRWLRIEISLDCSGIAHRPPGIRVRQRERLRLNIDPDFPWDHPAVHATHRDWAGTPHVQWSTSLCLYAAPTVEWQPHDGMFGLLERLNLWLRQAAIGELDPAGAPLHPPVAFPSGDAPRLVIYADVPTVTDTAWIGFAQLRRRSRTRLDVVDWTDDLLGDSEDVAPVVLLPTPMDWEYPTTVRGTARRADRTWSELAQAAGAAAPRRSATPHGGGDAADRRDPDAPRGERRDKAAPRGLVSVRRHR